MTTDLTIAVISGSLREHSLNTALLRAAEARLPDGVRFVWADIGTLPHFNSDLDAEAVPSIAALRETIGGADALMIATPEYNYSIPGVLKNALDWASRPAYRSPLTGKPTAIVGAAMSWVGSARAQGHLKHIMLGVGGEVFPYPEFLLFRAHEKFDEGGTLTDAVTGEFLDKFVTAFIDWARRRID